MTVVANAGPVMALGKLERLHLLRGLHGQVLVPAAVYDEVVVLGRAGGHADAYAAQRAVDAGILVVVPAVELPGDLAAEPIDRGEQQAIGLAVQRQPAVVLLDDLLARRAAIARGLAVRGTLGVLVDAFRGGQLSWQELEAVVAEIRQRSDIWISPVLCERVLARLRQDAGCSGQGLA